MIQTGLAQVTRHREFCDPDWISSRCKTQEIRYPDWVSSSYKIWGVGFSHRKSTEKGKPTYSFVETF